MQAQLDQVVLQMRTTGTAYDEAVRNFKRAFIEVVLKDKRGNKCRAADALGVHRNTLTRMLEEVGLDPAEIRTSKRRVRAPGRGSQRRLNSRDR